MFNQNILQFGLIEDDLDLEKTEKVIQYIYKLYPLLKSEIVFDEKLQWLRYEPHHDKKDKLIVMEETVTSLDELSSYFKKADDFLSSTQLFQWVLIKSNMKELPQVKYALTIFVVHAAMACKV